MPPTDRLGAFVLAAFVIIVIPGPSVLFTISRAIALGRRAAVASVLGNSLGVYVQAIAVAFGLGAVIASSIVVFTAVRLIGAAYLVWMGVQMLRSRRTLSSVLDVAVERRSVSRIVREGFVVGITNPKVLVFFGAVLPQFIDRTRGGVATQMLVLGLVFIAIGFVSDSTWGLLAGTARMWLRRSPQRLTALSGAGGIAIVGLGLNLALRGRHD